VIGVLAVQLFALFLYSYFGVFEFRVYTAIDNIQIVSYPCHPFAGLLVKGYTLYAAGVVFINNPIVAVLIAVCFAQIFNPVIVAVIIDVIQHFRQVAITIKERQSVNVIERTINCGSHVYAASSPYLFASPALSIFKVQRSVMVVVLTFYSL
tara:strand:+ start:3318 stop:3773 length:456 start_codon:yes stop_codon:yes gene_type:complete